MNDKKKEIACVLQQDEKDCGAACLATITKHYGGVNSISQIRELAGTTKEGTTILGLVEAARKLNFQAEAYVIEDIEEDITLPAILHIIVDKGFPHYVVLHEYNKKQAIIADPALGIKKCTPEEVKKDWTGKIILMVPNEHFKKADKTDTGRFSDFGIPLKDNSDEVDWERYINILVQKGMDEAIVQVVINNGDKPEIFEMLQKEEYIWINNLVQKDEYKWISDKEDNDDWKEKYLVDQLAFSDYSEPRTREERKRKERNANRRVLELIDEYEFNEKEPIFKEKHEIPWYSKVIFLFINKQHKEFSQLLSPQRKTMEKILLLSLIYLLIGIGVSNALKYLIDYILPNQTLSILNLFFVGLVVSYIAQLFFDFTRSRMLISFERIIEENIITSYFFHIVNLPISFFENRKNGEITSRMEDAANVKNTLADMSLTYTLEIATIIIVGIFLFIQNPLLFLVASIKIPLFLIIVLFFRKYFKVKSVKMMVNRGNYESFLIEALQGIETVKSYNAQLSIKKKINRKLKMFLNESEKLAKTANIQNTLTNAIELIGTAFILWYGAQEILKGVLTIGELLTFYLLLPYFSNPIQKIINLQPVIEEAKTALARITDVFDLEREDNQYLYVANTLKKDIHLKNVSFYFPSQPLLLNDINLTIKNGEKIAIVGMSGTGKSTLLKLLSKFYKSTDGVISYGKMNVNKIDLEFLREKVSYIPQESFFFSGTIKENLCLGNKELIEKEDIYSALYLVEADTFVTDVSEMLTENASNLSGGQKQKLAIARAILRKPDVYLLDESTSSLDVEAENTIMNYLLHHSKATTLFITHRLNTVVKFDRIVVMDQGTIVEVGTHDELMNNRCFYYNMWEESGIENRTKAGVEQSL